MAEVPTMPGATGSDIRPLGYELEYTCPPALSHKPISGATWPLDICGPSTRTLESGSSFLRRRYLETLYLPEVRPSRFLSITQSDIDLTNGVDLDAFAELAR